MDKNSIMWPPGQQEKDKPEKAISSAPAALHSDTGTYKQTTDKKKSRTNTSFKH